MEGDQFVKTQKTSWRFCLKLPDIEFTMAAERTKFLTMFHAVDGKRCWRVKHIEHSNKVLF